MQIGRVNESEYGMNTRTHSRKAIEDVDVVAGVEVVDGTFAVDLKGI